jgi:hypothetical protein
MSFGTAFLGQNSAKLIRESRIERTEHLPARIENDAGYLGGARF